MGHKLIVQDINKEIKGNIVLNNISFSATGGKVYGIVGKNGSGKTMLFRALSGLIYLDSGIIKMDDTRITPQMKEKPNIGLLIENASLYPNLTGAENLRFLSHIKGVITEKDICDIMYSVGLDPYDVRTYKKYSLGMKQRLLIAQAMMEKPDFLFLDEPTNALDQDGIKTIRNMIRSSADRGAVVIMASHNKEDMHELADEMFSMVNGRLEHL